MNGRVLANAGVFALGIILIIGGGWAIARGSGYVQLEWGWTSVIAGSIAATGGVLTLAIGFVLQRLDAVHGALLRAGASADAFTPPPSAITADEPANEPPPLGIAPAGPLAHAPEPQGAAHSDPALQAAAAVNLELLAHEEPPAAPGHHPHPAPSAHGELGVAAGSEPPPEVIHAADQGPADDMVKAAGVSDEPELDAALEELLAEERGKRSDKAPAVELPSALSAEQESEAAPAALAVEPEAERAPQRSAGWRGLFSRKERRTVAPPGPEEQPVFDASAAREEQQPVPAPEEHAPAEHAPAIHADALPRTGDDWFDRALSGLDEVSEPYARPGRTSAPQTDHLAVAADQHKASASASEEVPSGAPHPEPAVMGRYTSGNTTYIMFADGSIEAETPNGVLHFASLADLKVYVEGQ